MAPGRNPSESPGRIEEARTSIRTRSLTRVTPSSPTLALALAATSAQSIRRKSAGLTGANGCPFFITSPDRDLP